MSPWNCSEAEKLMSLKLNRRFVSWKLWQFGFRCDERCRSRDRPSADALLFPLVSTCEGNGANESRLAESAGLRPPASRLKEDHWFPDSLHPGKATWLPRVPRCCCGGLVLLAWLFLHVRLVHVLMTLSASLRLSCCDAASAHAVKISALSSSRAARHEPQIRIILSLNALSAPPPLRQGSSDWLLFKTLIG